MSMFERLCVGSAATGFFVLIGATLLSLII
jgi:hypothetical protein